jgi:hypothetical protein
VGKVKLILAVGILALLVSTGWQIAACELANFELQDELKDLASQNGAKIGLAAPRSDDDLRDAVIGKAREHDIALKPGQVTVRRSGSADAPVLYLAVRYSARVILPGYSFTFNFAPNTRR